MRAINAGLILIVCIISFFAADKLKIGRLQRTMFDKLLVNINMDMLVTDVLDSAVVGIDEKGEAVLSRDRADLTYEKLVQRSMGEGAAKQTAFMLVVGNAENIAAEALEQEASAQIKTVNKRLNYSFLFTEKTSSCWYNPICENSIYIMFLPRASNLMRLGHNDIIYTLSGAKAD